MDIKWTPNLSVNEKTIDSQHQRLFKQINLLYDALEQGKPEKAIQEILKFLEKYITEHFTYEEIYMDKHRFPGLFEHKKIHGSFIETYNQMIGEYKSQGYTQELSEKFKSILGSWWLNHVSDVDQKYAEYIKEHFS